MSNGLFEVLASQDTAEQERLARGRATIAVQTRAKQRFETFVSKAKTPEEREARIEVISGDLDKIAEEVIAEHGFITLDEARALGREALGGGHPAGCDCGFCKNKGKLPGAKKDDDGDEDDEPMEDKESSAKADCDHCEDCKDECTGHEDMKTSKIDIKQASASASEFPWDVVAAEDDDDEDRCDRCGKKLSEDEGEGYDGLCGNCADKAEEEGKFSSQRSAADVETGDTYAQDRVDVATGPDASPKIDKGKSGDETGWNLKPIEVPSERHPSEQQSPTDRADYNSEDFDPSSPVRDRVDADTPMQPEHNVGAPTTTWTGTEGQASPVTSAVLSKWTVLP